MAYKFPPVPHNPGHTFLATKPVIFKDHRIGKTETFPVFLFRCDASGELCLVTQDKYEAVLDKLIENGAFAGSGVVS